MINKKIAVSGLSILSSLALMAGASFALFSDANSSEDNIFSAGSLVLELDDENEVSISSSISASIGGSDMAPGDFVDGFISLHNAGSIPMSEVIFGSTQTSTVDGGDGSNLSDVLDLTVETGSDSTCETNNVPLTGTIAGAIGDTFLPLTLSELVASDYNALAGLAADGDPGDEYFLCLTATLEAGAGNTYQGDSVTVDFDFTGNQ